MMGNFCFSSPGVHPNPELPSGVLQISSDGDDRGIFWGLKFSIPGFYWVGKIGKYIFGWLDLAKHYYKAHHNVYCLSFFKTIFRLAIPAFFRFTDYNVLTACRSENGQIERELFRNSCGLRFNVSFVDWTSVFVKSVLEASLNFTYVATLTLHHIDNGVLQVMRKVMERVSPADFLSF